MKFTLIIISFVSLVILSCSTTQAPVTEAQQQAFDAIIEGASFKIENDWALPQNTNAMMQLQNSGILNPANRNMTRISLIDNPNNLTIKDGTVSSQLPYFGEVQVPSRVNVSDNGITLEGAYKNYTIKDGKKGSKLISFDAKSAREGFKVTIELFPNLKTAMLINGSKRLPIRYTGKASLISN